MLKKRWVYTVTNLPFGQLRMWSSTLQCQKTNSPNSRATSTLSHSVPTFWHSDTAASSTASSCLLSVAPLINPVPANFGSQNKLSMASRIASQPAFPPGSCFNFVPRIRLACWTSISTSDDNTLVFIIYVTVFCFLCTSSSLFDLHVLGSPPISKPLPPSSPFP